MMGLIVPTKGGIRRFDLDLPNKRMLVVVAKKRSNVHEDRGGSCLVGIARGHVSRMFSCAYLFTSIFLFDAFVLF